MSDRPSMPLFVDDYEAATPHLTLAEDGAYNRLLRLCWRSPDCSVPDDPEWLRRKMRVSQAEYDDVVAPIIEEFFTRKKGKLFQKRQRSVYRNVSEMISRKKEAGKKGAAAKHSKNNDNASGKAAGTAGGKRMADGQQSHSTQTQTQTQREKDHPSDDAKRASDLSKKKTPRQQAKDMELPDCVPRDAWQEWVDYRFDRDRKVTLKTFERAIGTLKRLYEAGNDPAQVIEQSIERGWQGLFEVKQRQGRTNGAADHSEKIYDPDDGTPCAAGAVPHGTGADGRPCLRIRYMERKDGSGPIWLQEWQAKAALEKGQIDREAFDRALEEAQR